MFNVLSTAVDSVLALKSFAAHCAFFDVEQSGDGFALMMRSRDKTVFGKTDKPELCEFLFNDKAGAAVPFILATSPDRAPLDAAAQHLIAFYSSDTALFSARYAALGEVARAVLPFAMSFFGAKRRNRNGWKVGSIHGISAAESAAAEKRIKDASKALNNKDALASAIAAAQSGEVSNVPADLLAIIQQVMSACQSGGALPTVAPVAPVIPPVVAPSAVQPTIEPAAQGMTIDDLMAELTSPTDDVAQLYADAIEHIASGGAEVESLYIEALQESDEPTDFVSAVETLLAERAEAIAA